MTAYTTDWGLPKPDPSDLIAGSNQNLRRDLGALADKVEQSLHVVDTKVKDVSGKLFFKGALRGEDNLDTLHGPGSQGRYSVESTNAGGLPTNALGSLDVYYNSSDGRTVQEFSRSTSQARYINTYRRVYSGETWGHWESASWIRGALSQSKSFDSDTSLGIYQIETTLNPGNPAGTTGTLEVKPSSGLLLQMFTSWTSPPKIYQRRQITQSSWSNWDVLPSGGDILALTSRVSVLEQSGGGGERASAIPRGPLETREAQIIEAGAGERADTMSKDRKKLYTALSTTLHYSEDDGNTWLPVHTFSGVAMELTVPLDNGELLVAGSDSARQRRIVWVSEGLHTDDEVWHEVLQAPYHYVKFVHWSHSTYKNIVVLAEYGPKSGAPWGDSPSIPRGESAVRIYLSTDSGMTWKIVFNLEDYLVNELGRNNADLQHLHGVAWDPYWDRIWASWGDNLGGVGSNGIVYSDDLGQTWNVAYTSLTTNDPTQVVGIHPMPRCVLFFGDMGDHISRIDRAPGKNASHQLVQAYNSTAAGRHLCQGHYQAQRLGSDAPLLAAFSTEGATGQDFVTATMDGYTFVDVWRNDNSIGTGRGVRHPSGPTIFGSFHAVTNASDGSVGNWAKLKIPATGY